MSKSRNRQDYKIDEIKRDWKELTSQWRKLEDSVLRPLSENEEADPVKDMLTVMQQNKLSWRGNNESDDFKEELDPLYSKEVMRDVYPLFEKFIEDHPQIFQMKGGDEFLHKLSGLPNLFDKDLKALTLMLIDNCGDLNKFSKDKKGTDVSFFDILVSNSAFKEKGLDVDTFTEVFGALIDKGMKCDLNYYLKNVSGRKASPENAIAIAKVMFSRDDKSGFLAIVDYVNSAAEDGSDLNSGGSVSGRSQRSSGSVLSASQRRARAGQSHNSVDGLRRQMSKDIVECLATDEFLDEELMLSIVRNETSKEGNDRGIARILKSVGHSSKGRDVLENVIRDNFLLHKEVDEEHGETFNVIIRYSGDLLRCVDLSGLNPISYAISRGQALDYIEGYINGVREFGGGDDAVVSLLNQKDNSDRTALDNYLNQEVVNNDAISYLMKLGGEFSSQENPLIPLVVMERKQPGTLKFLLRCGKCDEFVNDELVRNIFSEEVGRNKVVMDAFLDGVGLDNFADQARDGNGMHNQILELSLESKRSIVQYLLEYVDGRNIDKNFAIALAILPNLNDEHELSEGSNPISYNVEKNSDDNGNMRIVRAVVAADHSVSEYSATISKEEFSRAMSGQRSWEVRNAMEANREEKEYDGQGSSFDPDRPLNIFRIVDMSLSRMQSLREGHLESEDLELATQIGQKFRGFIYELFSRGYKNSSYSDERLENMLDGACKPIDQHQGAGNIKETFPDIADKNPPSHRPSSPKLDDSSGLPLKKSFTSTIPHY